MAQEYIHVAKENIGNKIKAGMWFKKGNGCITDRDGGDWVSSTIIPDHLFFLIEDKFEPFINSEHPRLLAEHMGIPFEYFMKAWEGLNIVNRSSQELSDYLFSQAYREIILKQKG